MVTLDYLAETFQLDLSGPSPIMFPLERPEMVKIYAALGFTKGAEIGVQKGEHAQFLCDSVPGLELWAVDPWREYPDYKDLKFTRQWYYDRLHAEAIDRLSGRNAHILVKESVEALADVPDASLDFVYIDANHEFLHATQDIAGWSKKVRPGGIIGGHDFYLSNTERLTVHVEHVVRAWTAAHEIDPWFVLTGKTGPHWMWVI